MNSFAKFTGRSFFINHDQLQYCFSPPLLLYCSNFFLFHNHKGPTMVKLVAMYRIPDDTKSFDEHYYNIHTPLVQKYPGLRKLEVAKVYGAPIGEPKQHLIAEMYFDNHDAMQNAFRSAEGKAAASDLMEFAGKLVSMFYADVQE
jgi:uncharacterized protein (TIGR02118 family)